MIHSGENLVSENKNSGKMVRCITVHEWLGYGCWQPHEGTHIISFSLPINPSAACSSKYYTSQAGIRKGKHSISKIVIILSIQGFGSYLIWLKVMDST